MPTLADVAQQAGVSVSTAGRVLSERGYASDTTRRRVLQAAGQVGYVPNQIARSLRTRRSRLIGLLIGDVENGFYSVIASTVESTVKDSGYHVVLCNSDDEPKQEREYLRVLQQMRVDGMIITPTARNRTHLAQLAAEGMAIVQIDRQVEGLEADAVLVDNEGGAAAAVFHLVDAGHERIGILTGPQDVPTGRQRLAGYRRALDEAGVGYRSEYVRAASFHREHAFEGAIELMNTDPAPTAVFAANNILAEAAMLAFKKLGLRVPQDVSLVAFDDAPWMSVVSPALTAVRQPVIDMARSAAELMLRRLEDGTGRAPRVSIFQLELISRQSVSTLARTGVTGS